MPSDDLDSDDFRIIPCNCVPGLVHVRVYAETIQHIFDNHPEISRTFVGTPSFDHALTTTISDPSWVEESYANSVVFVNDSATNWSGQPMRVPVKVLADKQSGYMKTAFFGTTETPDALIYTKAKADE